MEVTSRYLIGIDLGTTNTAVAYLDTHESPVKGDTPPIRVFRTPQLVAEGEVRALPGLPSFLYFASEQEMATGRLRLPWDPQPQSSIVGWWAREQGALVPGRQVSSAKSWLCLSTVDRTADILPWGAEEPERSCSPVTASARYLSHLRDAWNFTMDAAGDGADEARFEKQEIVLTVPASFDEEARELTVQAAREARLERITLLEEPLAAFYAWISGHRNTLKRQLKDGQSVLICDVGGGTTDLSLIRVQVEGPEVRFTRTAIGEHLLLGGDNLDLALSHLVEEKLGHPALTLRQQNGLRRQCCAAKETLLSDAGPDRVPLTILGGGRAVVGGALRAELARADVERVLLEGFLPLTAAEEIPARDRRAGLRELGLPYAREAAITKHLAAFLRQAASTPDEWQRDAPENRPQMVCPDAILFNGGFFLPELARERLVAALRGWFPEKGQNWSPKILSNRSLESAVALGAVYYARVKGGAGLRISGGSARGYYIGVQPSGAEHRSGGEITAVCVLPRGTDEGTRLELEGREFTVLTNRPVSFTLYSSVTRQDPLASVVALAEDEVHRHAPLVTSLRYGKRSRHTELDVNLSAHFTEVGTLELWCEAPKTGHRWRLQFQLRGAADQDEGDDQPSEPEASAEVPQVYVSAEAVQAAEKAIRAVFGGPRDTLDGEPLTPEALTGRLESIVGYRKDSWRMETIRKLCDALADVAAGRRKGRTFEARWLNLFGFCLRPGFGAALDEWRITQARKIYQEGIVFPKDVQCEVEWLILWRRVAGGLNAGQQRELYERYRSMMGIGVRRAKGRVNRQVDQEGCLLFASLEHLPAGVRVALGRELLDRIEEDPGNKGYLWSLGRLGARTPFYGPLNCVVPAETAGQWIKALIELPQLNQHVASAMVQLGSLTRDPLRDIDPSARQLAIERLSAAGIEDELVEKLRTFVPQTHADDVRVFGESLPEGLRLVR